MSHTYGWFIFALVVELMFILVGYRMFIRYRYRVAILIARLMNAIYGQEPRSRDHIS